MQIWLDGKLVPKHEALVSVFDHGLLYGDGCFEGIRTYGGRVMKLQSHLTRLYESAAHLRLTPPFPREVIEDAVQKTLAANELREGYIRLVFTRGVGGLGLSPFKCPKASAFIIADRIDLYARSAYDSGLAVIIANRPRVPRACLDPAIKSLNYLNNILAKVEAIDRGAMEAIMLNLQGEVTEGTGDNVFLVKNGQLVTPSVESGLLHGVTRRFVMSDLAPAIGKHVVERAVRPEELFKADEVFLTGTAAEIIGVTSINKEVVGRGQVGPVTRALMAGFAARIARGVPED